MKLQTSKRGFDSLLSCRNKEISYGREHIAQLVERRPFKPRVLGSSPNMLMFFEKKKEGVISSGVEQLAVNQKVDGSNPSLPFFLFPIKSYKKKRQNKENICKKEPITQG